MFPPYDTCQTVKKRALGEADVKKFKITVNNQVFDVNIEDLVDEKAFVKVNGISYEVGIERIIEKRRDETGRKTLQNRSEISSLPQRKIDIDRKPPASSKVDNSGCNITAPLPGLIIDLLITEGDAVKSGEVVIRMEAMKMENDIISPRDGVIKKIMVTKGAEVREGEILVELGDG